MNIQTKTKEELIYELKVLQEENNLLKTSKGKRVDELVIAKEEKGKRADELVIANKELVYQNEEKEKRAAELVIANKELVYQNEEKEKRAAELVIANKELVYQNNEKEKRAAELENANKELEQFAYVAAHDLQEPLRMISSYTQLLERKYKDKLDQDANDYIQFAVVGAIRMQNLFNDLLEFSRIKSYGKSFDQVDITTVIGQVVSNLQFMIVESTALITNDDLPTLKADESQIVRLFQNLIGNAIKFKKKTPSKQSGTELPRIHISCKKKNNMYQFSVADNGIGIEMQYHDKIFVIFQRLHSAKYYSGTGIGLSICKRIVERHGGTIWFETILNKGSTFYFTIPE